MRVLQASSPLPLTTYVRCFYAVSPASLKPPSGESSAEGVPIVLGKLASELGQSGVGAIGSWGNRELGQSGVSSGARIVVRHDLAGPVVLFGVGWFGVFFWAVFLGGFVGCV